MTMHGLQGMGLRSASELEFTISDALLGLKNRCRLVPLVEDMETLFMIEGIEPIAME